MDILVAIAVSFFGSVVTGLVAWGGVRSDIKTLFKNDQRHDVEIRAVDARVDRLMDRH